MKKRSYLELIMGSMYSGKSEELIRRVKRLRIAGKKVQLFKPAIDNRYSNTDVITHAGESSEAEVFTDINDLRSKIDFEHTFAIGLDEIQFASDDIVLFIEELNNKGIKVIAAGLDMYTSGEPFGPMPILAIKAKFVDKLHAVCVKCGEKAYISQKLEKENNKLSQVDVGSFGKYIAVCEDCRYEI